MGGGKISQKYFSGASIQHSILVLVTTECGKQSSRLFSVQKGMQQKEFLKLDGPMGLNLSLGRAYSALYRPFSDRSARTLFVDVANLFRMSRNRHSQSQESGNFLFPVLVFDFCHRRIPYVDVLQKGGGISGCKSLPKSILRPLYLKLYY